MKNYLFAFALCFCSFAYAAPISRIQAFKLATAYLSSTGSNIRLQKTEHHPMKRKVGDNTSYDAYYVFNIEGNKGFVIASGDDSTVPILGYSEVGTFDEEHIPDNMRAWLDEYERQIAFIQNHPSIIIKNINSVNRSEVAPLLTTHWGQYEPYNDECSIELSTDTIQAVTGCVATAMAQIMNYYKYPSATIAEIPSYEIRYRRENKIDTIHFPVIPANSKIDWAYMLDDYSNGYTERQAKAVADLMHYCGLSVEMIYSTYGSGASSGKVQTALKKFFGYGPSTRYVEREDYTSNEWDELIYGEVSNKRPVYYAGKESEESSGHAFVIDGYKNGYYHVNWGWEGDYDGYYILSVLNPYEEYLDEDDDAGGYSFNQHATLITIENDEYHENITLTTTDAKLTKGKTFTRQSSQDSFDDVGFEFSFKSTLADTYDIDINFAVYEGNSIKSLMRGTTTLINYGAGNHTTFSFSGSFFYWLTGIYQIVMVSKKSGDDTWNVNHKSDIHCITAEITETTLKLSETAIKPIDENLLERYDNLLAEAKDALEQAKGKDTHIELIPDVSHLSSPYTEASEGSLAALLDKNTNTFWHSVWRNGPVEGGLHYLQVNIVNSADMDQIYASFTRRPTSRDHVTNMSVFGTNNPNATKNDCEELLTYDCPYTSYLETIASPTFNAKGYRYLRFYANTTTDNRGYWHISEFQLYGIPYSYSTAALNLMDEDERLQDVINSQRGLLRFEINEDVYNELKEAYEAFIARLTELVDNIKETHPDETGEAYDLQGRKLPAPQNGLNIIRMSDGTMRKVLRKQSRR